MRTTINAMGRNATALTVANEGGETMHIVLLWDEMRDRWTVRSHLRDTGTLNVLTDIKEVKHERKIKGKAALRAQQ